MDAAGGRTGGLLSAALRALGPRARPAQPGGAGRPAASPLLFLLHRAMAAGGLLLHRSPDHRGDDAVPDERARGPHLVRLPLPANHLDRPVLRRRALGRGRPARTHPEGQARLDLQPCARGRHQALPVADDRLVDRRRLGAVFRRCADAGEGSRHLPGAVHRLSLDRHPDRDHLCVRRPRARAGLHLHVSLAAYPGRADGRMGAQRHLPARPRRAAYLHQEGRAAAPRRRTCRRLRRLPSVHQCLPDRRRHPQRHPARLHSMRPVHRCVRRDHAAGQPADRTDRLRHRHQRRAPACRQTADLSPDPAAHRALRRHYRRGRQHHAVHAGDPQLDEHQRAARTQPAVRHLERRQRPQRLYRALSQQGRRVPFLRAGSARPSRRRDSHGGDRTRRGRETDRRGRTGPDQGSQGVRCRCRRPACPRKQPTSSSRPRKSQPARPPRCAITLFRLPGRSDCRSPSTPSAPAAAPTAGSARTRPG